MYTHTHTFIRCIGWEALAEQTKSAPNRQIFPPCGFVCFLSVFYRSVAFHMNDIFVTCSRCSHELEQEHVMFNALRNRLSSEISYNFNGITMNVYMAIRVKCFEFKTRNEIMNSKMYDQSKRAHSHRKCRVFLWWFVDTQCRCVDLIWVSATVKCDTNKTKWITETERKKKWWATKKKWTHKNGQMLCVCLCVCDISNRVPFFLDSDGCCFFVLYLFRFSSSSFVWRIFFRFIRLFSRLCIYFSYVIYII